MDAVLDFRDEANMSYVGAGSMTQASFVTEDDVSFLRLKANKDADDPYIFMSLPDVLIKCKEYKVVLMKVRRTQGSNVESQFFFITDESGLSESASERPTYKDTTDWQYVIINLGANNNYSGQLQSIRLDYFRNSPGSHHLDVQYIALFETTEAAEAFHDNFDDFKDQSSDNSNVGNTEEAPDYSTYISADAPADAVNGKLTANGQLGYLYKNYPYTMDFSKTPEDYVAEGGFIFSAIDNAKVYNDRLACKAFSSYGFSTKKILGDNYGIRGGSLDFDMVLEKGTVSVTLRQIMANDDFVNSGILYRVVQMIDKEKWVSMSSDVKGEIYEGLLQKNAEDIKSGAGQYFTPRPLIRAMVRCLRPEPGKTIADPCCGSGGFFLAAQEYLTDPANYTLDREQKEFLKNETFFGNELVKTTFKMALMNLYLHNIGDIYGNVPVTQGDSLLTDPGYRVDYVLTNPPFGKKSSITMTNEEGEEEEEDLVYNRQDFWTTSSNKQLNFVQHINTIMKATGKAAVVVPDNVLFEGGAGETVRQKLLQTTDLHTILRLPTGIFYKPGVKANVIFFDKKPASPETQTKEIWIYDFRTNVHFTLKQHPMADGDLEDFIACYNPANRHDRHETWSEENPEGRFRRFKIEDILKRDKTSLDIFWIKDKSLANLDNLPSPDELAEEIIENLQSALESFMELTGQLGS